MGKQVSGRALGECAMTVFAFKFEYMLPSQKNICHIFCTAIAKNLSYILCFEAALMILLNPTDISRVVV